MFVKELSILHQQNNKQNRILEFFQNPNDPSVGDRLYDYMVPFFPLVQNSEGFGKSDTYGYYYDYINEGMNYEIIMN